MGDQLSPTQKLHFALSMTAIVAMYIALFGAPLGLWYLGSRDTVYADVGTVEAVGLVIGDTIRGVGILLSLVSSTILSWLGFA